MLLADLMTDASALTKELRSESGITRARADEMTQEHLLRQRSLIEQIARNRLKMRQFTTEAEWNAIRAGMKDNEEPDGDASTRPERDAQQEQGAMHEEQR